MTAANIARILHGSPLSRPRNAVFAAIVLVVLLLISTVSLFRGYFAALSPAAVQVFIISFLATLLVTLFPLAILWFLDRREPESRWLYLIALLWGAVIATGIALPINYAIFKGLGDFVALHPDIKAILGGELAGRNLAAPIAGPVVEETFKGLGVLLLFWLFRSEFDNVRDGFIYGALVGIGFNLLEAPLYITNGFNATGDFPLYFQIADRFALFGFAGHALYTGMFGMGLGLARQTTRRLRVAAPIGGWLLGFSGHFLNNALGLLLALFVYFLTGKPLPNVPETAAVAPAVVEPLLNQWVQHSAIRLVGFFPFFLIVGVMLWQSGVWERNVIREQLADEQEPVITPEEYEAVKRDRIFRTRRIPGYNRRTSAAIVRAQDELAFRKWRVQQMGQSPEKDALVASWRNELTRLRQENQAIAAWR